MPEGPQPEFLQPPVRADGPVRLVDPDPEWAAQYARQEARIRAALGPRAVQVEHVGSTSVPGLAAKPVIDIVLVVADSAYEAAYVPDLEAAGYALQFREPDWYEHRFLTRSRPGCADPRVLRRQSRGGADAAVPRSAAQSIPRSVSCMNAPSASLLSVGGPTSRTTPTPSRRSSRKSSREPKPVKVTELRRSREWLS